MARATPCRRPPLTYPALSLNLSSIQVLTGFLGSGKTTLLNHLLTQPHCKRLAIIENEFGEVDVDSELVAITDNSLTSSCPTTSTAERIVSLSNGCLCCTAGATSSMPG
jgi:G3E family GTPase